MSTKLTGYVWDGCAASGMKLSSVAIMARLADFSNDEGVCWPSIETIARQIGAGMSTVRTAIARLEAEGWLTRKARRQGNRNASNVYQLNVAKLQAAAFSQLSDSDPSKSDASKSDPSKFDASKSGKKAGFHPSESGGDPSVKSKHDPSDKKIRCISDYRKRTYAANNIRNKYLNCEYGGVPELRQTEFQESIEKICNE